MCSRNEEGRTCLYCYTIGSHEVPSYEQALKDKIEWLMRLSERGARLGLSAAEAQRIGELIPMPHWASPNNSLYVSWCDFLKCLALKP